MASGGPQGSVLGPLLFIAFVNEMDAGLLNKLLKFADDAKLFGRITSEEDHRSLQQDLCRLAQWSETWLMPFNVSKCKVMTLSTSATKHPRQYYIKGQPLERVTEEKDLGVLLRTDLKSSIQCTTAYNKASAICLGL